MPAKGKLARQAYDLMLLMVCLVLPGQAPEQGRWYHVSCGNLQAEAFTVTPCRLPQETGDGELQGLAPIVAGQVQVRP